MWRDFGIYGKKRTQSLSKLPVLLLTLFAGVSCWIFQYYCAGDPLEPVSATPLWHWMSGLLTDRRSVYLAGMILLFASAGLLQRANYYLLIIREKTKLPFLLFFLLNSANFGFVPLRPVSVAVFFVLLCMVELFKSCQDGKTEMTQGNAYKAMFCLGVGSLIWVQLFWMIPLFWYGMYQFRLLNVRTFAVSILGMITVYWLLGGWCAWKHDLSALTDVFRSASAINIPSLRELLSAERLITPASAFILTVIVDISLRFHKANAGLRTRRFISFLLTSMKYLLPFLFLFETLETDFLCLFYLPASFLTAYVFSNTFGKAAPLYYGLLLVVSVVLLAVRYV
ncbi:MAG: hypothetical protein LBT76_05580 [Tannerella sp.]|jgi:hypothetical protein|nr:hypothetical protein [Tannerella sp.]